MSINKNKEHRKHKPIMAVAILSPRPGNFLAKKNNRKKVNKGISTTAAAREVLESKGIVCMS
jgi:hypothetical protein